MTSVIRSRGGTDRAVLWLACLVAVGLGYYLAFYRLGAAIDAQHDSSGQYAAIMRANTAIIAARPDLERTEHLLDQTLGTVNIRADHATTVARFIRECARITTLHHTKLVQIDERQSTATETHGASNAAGTSPFEVIPLDVTLAGSYRNLVGTIRELVQAPVAMRIEIAALDRVGAPDTADAADTGDLTARLHVTVERLANDTALSAAALLAPQEPAHARSY